MKKILYLSFCLLLFSSFNKSASDELKWYKWNEAYPLAQKDGKILLIDAYTDWCGWCKKMDRDTYSNADVIKKINKHFIPVKFNPELKELTYDIDGQTYSARDFYAQLTRGENTGFPTTYFIDPKKKSLFIDPGYRDAAAFMQILDKVIADK
ncbi:MAG: DUF255 domain-containing protein [Bacteroidia bacterium]|nr:DUF255 domain-containing protein [Bacteroidia bacterium]